MLEFDIPEYSKWKCYLFGNRPGEHGMIWQPLKGKEPNFFWRIMQYLIIGNYWVKEKK